ncbi:MAG: methyltransferase domain-containing protein [Gammaproteobacteria bacterium]|nr:methyltransferase domain-containing protein [Gammaproteobacteria bacterium]
MSGHEKLTEHYTHGDLLGAIYAGIAALGKTPDSVTIDDLAPVDEFHIGGRQASEDFLDQLNLSEADHVLDVGCGLGGASRFVASRYRSRVTGIDLTAEYVDTGQALCAWLRLDDRITLRQGSALSMPFEDSAFDGGYMMHVGMNIEDKAGLYSEVYRVLRPGTSFGVYDVMRVGDGELTYPVPWATTSDASAVASPEQYKQALQHAGFAITAERNRRDFALAFFEQLRAKAAATNGPPPLGLHILMGDSAVTKVQNMIENVSAGRVAPVELIARKVS